MLELLVAGSEDVGALDIRTAEVIKVDGAITVADDAGAETTTLDTDGEATLVKTLLLAETATADGVETCTTGDSDEMEISATAAEVATGEDVLCESWAEGAVVATTASVFAGAADVDTRA